MPKPEIQLRFEGGDADRNTVQMKYYALALQGMDEMLSDGLILLAEQRLPKPRERAPVLVKARESIGGSHVTPSDLSEAYDVLSLGLPIVTEIGPDFLWNWVKGILSYFSGKQSDMEVAVAGMVKINQDHLAARDRSDERMHTLTAELLRAAIYTQGAAAERFAAPVGRSVERAELYMSSDVPVALDRPDAEAIREHGKVVWEKIAQLRLETDGFKFHTNGLSVRNPEGDGYMMATVKDPTFADEENAYTEAAQRRATVSVLARKGRRNGVLAKLEILEFEGIVDEKPA